MSVKVPPGMILIFRPFITRNGKRIFRSDGKMWAFPVPDDGKA